MNKGGTSSVRIAMALVVALLAGVMVGCTGDTGGTAGPMVGADCTNPPQLVPGASLFGCSLMGFDLSGLDLSGANLSGADLSGVNLSGSNLTNANLEGANLTGANLTEANLTGAILSGAILIGAIFLNAILKGALFDYGKVFGATGSGGNGTPVGGANAPGGTGSCTGPYCPGYNEATVDLGIAPLCSPDLYDETEGEFYSYRSQQDLADAGLRSVVTDSSTSFEGALLDFSDAGFAAFNLRALNVGKADFSNSTIIRGSITCQNADGARFHGATIHGLGDGSNRAFFYDSSLKNSDFSDTKIWLTAFSDVTFAGSNAQNADWTASGIEVAGIFPPEAQALIPRTLVDLSNVNFQGALLGVTDNPTDGRHGLKLGGYVDGDGTYPLFDLFSTTFAGADLRNAQIKSLENPGGNFVGAQTDGVTVWGWGTVAGAVFDSGWLGAAWFGDYDFDGATCPDGSLGSPANPCF